MIYINAPAPCRKGRFRGRINRIPGLRAARTSLILDTKGRFCTSGRGAAAGRDSLANFAGGSRPGGRSTMPHVRGGAPRSAVIACLAIAACLLGSTVTARAQGAIRSVHGDWQIRCETPPGAQNEQCALFQSVVAEDRANVGITVLVLKTADQSKSLMRVQAPLGVLLPAGLGLKIDNADVGRAGFVKCLPRGCYAEAVIKDPQRPEITLLEQLRKGTTATFFIFQTPEEGIGFPLSLKGFGEGYDQLP
jgi:invasion protein IalB